MSDYEFTLSLRIRHPRMDPSVITSELSIEPSTPGRPAIDASTPSAMRSRARTGKAIG